MDKRWHILPHDAEQIRRLEQTAGVSAVVAQLLVCRGVTCPADARVFLEAKLNTLRDPELLPGLTDAADRIHAAVAAGRRMVIYGDYDADGMTGTAILFRCLKLLGADVGYHVPCRLLDGYGLHDDVLQKLADRGASMVISVDCGITSCQAAELASQLGLELIVTDHHQMGTQLPSAAALVHPALPGSDYPFTGLCGAGVAFKLAWALCQRASEAKRVRPAMREFLMAAMGLAALGTVADVVPLIDENRVLVRHGLVSLRQRPVPGMAALMKLTGLDQKPALGGEDIGFTLAPRLNAAGRLGQALLGVELLTTDSEDRATSLAEYLNQLNSSRDSLERSVYQAAFKQAREQFDPHGDPALVLDGVDWHPGVIGIVAGRLAERFHRPVVMISWDRVGAKPGIGSCRSAGGFDLYQALRHCGEYLLSHGGHRQAAGLKLERSSLDAFRVAFCEHAAEEISLQDQVAEIRIDAEATFSQLTPGTLAEIERLAPFGQSNPRPVICASGVELASPPQRMGQGERHLTVRLKHLGCTLRGVAFGRGEAADEIASIDGPLDVAFRPVINEYRGRRSVEVHLLDWRPSRAPVVATR